MNTFDEAKERAAQDGTEWEFGAVQTDLALVPKELRPRYAPDGVLQYNDVFDTNGCASRAPLNILETKLNYFWDNGMHPNIQKWLTDNGYRVNGQVRLSDAFIEILSGTGPNGNSLKAPVDAIYRYGVIPASMLPLEKRMSREEYMNPDRITAEMLRLGKEFLKRIGINYEKVPYSQFLELLSKDLLDGAGHGWPRPKNGVYPRTEASFNHAFALENDAIDVQDGYEPFRKRIAKNYKLFEWGYSFSITRQTPFPDETMALFEVLKANGLLAFFAEALNRFINGASNSKPESVTEPTVPTPPVPEPEKPSDTRLIAALIKVESGGDDYAIGDKALKHKAYGCLQIRQPYMDDVNRVWGTNHKAQDCLGNRELSVRVARAYFKLYKGTTDEEKARLHNGGPSAKTPGTKQYSATNGYWQKVRKFL